MEKTRSNPCYDESLLQSLEHKINWNGLQTCDFQGFWCPTNLVRPLLSLQRNFKAHDTDIVIAAMPMSGATWTKALLFTIVNRKKIPIFEQSPLTSESTYKIVSSLECHHFAGEEDDPDLETLAQPRLFATHLPHRALAKSTINDSGCRIICVCRNPLDQFVSERCFFKHGPALPDGVACGDMLPLDQAFDMVCDGAQAFGPYWDHVLGYWNASLENPDKVLFLKYEDMEKDPISNVKKIAGFVGMPFSEAEEKEGLIEEIARACSFDSLKDLEVNKKGAFFRKGQVGDWKNHITVDMARRLKKITEEKLAGSGLVIDF